MLEAGRSIEIAIAELAAERGTSDHLAIISEEVTGMYASLDDPEQFLLHDVRFHQAVAAAAGNRILTSLMNMVATIVFDMRRKTVRRAQDLKALAAVHRQVYQAIRERSAKSARNAMRGVT
jgi:GntR family transcriptional repressor for pyruvate dehydrogenase complex